MAKSKEKAAAKIKKADVKTVAKKAKKLTEDKANSTTLPCVRVKNRKVLADKYIEKSAEVRVVTEECNKLADEIKALCPEDKHLTLEGSDDMLIKVTTILPTTTTKVDNAGLKKLFMELTGKLTLMKKMHRGVYKDLGMKDIDKKWEDFEIESDRKGYKKIAFKKENT